MRFVHTLRVRTVPMIVLGTALTLACSDGSPTAPDQASFAAATNSILWVDSRNVRIQCNVGTPCTAGIYVNVYEPVTLSYQIDGGDFIINSAATTCPQGGTVDGSCYLSVKVATTDVAGRRRATLVISESTFGTSLTVRLAARVS